MQIEYNEMKECTFKPRIKNFVSKSQRNLTDVNGINSFLKINELKKKKQEQKRNIEQRVFNLQKRYDQRQDKKTRIE